MKILTVLIIICNGSPGDRSSWYRSCFAKCTSENCDGVSELPAYSFPLTSLPCPLRCKAKCIESTHEIIKAKWQKQVQFFGKWPFRRIGNCEELASCVFSIGNLVFTIAGYLKAKRMFSSTNDKVLLFHAFVCSVGWIMSAQFHARETKTSEKMDYMGALAIVYTTLFLSLSRNFRHRSTQIGLALFACFYSHVYSMRNRIDYGLNMKLCVCLGIISLALWVRVYLIERSEALFKVSLISIGSALLLGLEILDFPPLYRIFDAHSLWHCGTMPAPWLLYPALMEDLYNVQTAKTKLP